MLSRPVVRHMSWLLQTHAVKSLGWVYVVTIAKTCCQSPGWEYAVTVAKTCCQEPWLGICHDCCQNMLSRAMVGCMPWLLPILAVRNHGWIHAVTVAKTCCQEPWLDTCRDCCQNLLSRTMVAYNGHDCCQNMLSTAIVEFLSHDSGLGWVDGPWLLPKHAVNNHNWVS